MAILRGGRRIGNFDIRIGLPRDKSLVDIDKDPRLKRRPGGAGQIQKFQSAIQEGEGFARANRYLVAFNLPGVSKLNQGIENNALSFNNAGEKIWVINVLKTQYIHTVLIDAIKFQYRKLQLIH